MNPWVLVAIGLGLVAWAGRGAGAAPGLSEQDRATVAAANAWRAMLGVPRSASIGVRRVEPHAWPDASLGLPEPGRRYAQSFTPGYLVELESPGGQVAEFHVAGDRAVYCPPCSAKLSAERSA